MVIARALADWAHSLTPTPDDRALAHRSLRDTLAVTLAAEDHPLVDLARDLPEEARWAAIGHVLDFDDLHLPSTAHISVVCVPAVLAVGGSEEHYLAAAGVMARLGTALGWRHYTDGWHATCTAGAPAAAVGAALALGLSPEGTATAMALAVPAAGGVQRAFGTDAKSLQVGFATHAGVRAARLAASGVQTDPTALDQWFALVGGDPDAFTPELLDPAAEAVPGGLATKIHPCCYAMQRPIGAVRALAEAVPDPAAVRLVEVETPGGTLHPLLHHRPTTGLQAKFSLEYAVATALLDGHPGFASFTDEAARRPEARRLVEAVRVRSTPGGDGLLDGVTTVHVTTEDGHRHSATLDLPAGAPGRPADETALAAKFADCGPEVPAVLAGATWATAPDLLRAHLSAPAVGAP
ncbi:MmgE/PrpD family protein [Nocardiopsis sp. MG754419]|uniref:MmgE/PrpD family protein n=1 Tax=Nocardiopsis sp. MG754419 TaxID=2259865 RepID=UPI001BA8937F|nr:MmgE/PrpD family protein [Nocardiopsis sp. MG754419]MBR8741805.1 2-methylcitrate dehydratase [Nocardiopsis sp. MG754419]